MGSNTRKIILINGQPGTGKTTLKLRLAADLALPALGKDDIKEFLFDTIRIGDASWSSLIGRVAVGMLNSATERFIEGGYDVIVENAFKYEFAHPDMSAIVKKTNAQVLEIYCQTSATVRRKRFDDRIALGDRHPGHSDIINELPDEEIAHIYRPLKLGRLTYVDTTERDEAMYTQLLVEVRTFLKEGKAHDQSY